MMAPLGEFILTIFTEKFLWRQLQQAENFEETMHQNSCINCISSKQNYEKISE